MSNLPSPFEVLILDFGSAISLTLFETHRQTEKALRLPEGTLKWMGPFNPDSGPLWADLEAGKIS